MKKNKILNRISEIEKIYYVEYFDKEKYIKETMIVFENILKIDIRNKIKLSKKNYKNREEILDEILKFLTVEQLRKIAYYQDVDK